MEKKQINLKSNNYNFFFLNKKYNFAQIWFAIWQYMTMDKLFFKLKYTEVWATENLTFDIRKFECDTLINNLLKTSTVVSVQT